MSEYKLLTLMVVEFDHPDEDIQKGDVIFRFHGISGQFLAMEMLTDSGEHNKNKFRQVQFRTAFNDLVDKLAEIGNGGAN